MSKRRVGEERAAGLENDLKGAWTRGEMDIQYQPEFNVKEYSLVCFEALTRWNHPRLGAIPPSTFIPIAEASGLIVPLGSWVLENACRRAAAWQKDGPPIGIAVNVSAVQFSRDDFVSMVVNAVERTGIAPELLQLELTESALLPDVEQTVTKMNELRAMGIALAIDDFGTGYSSVSYLERFPFTMLKIDRSFVQELTGNGYSGHVIEPLAALAHRFGMTVVIEGIETARQFHIARESGCDEAQGYLFGRPTSYPEATAESRAVGNEKPVLRKAATSVFPAPRRPGHDAPAFARPFIPHSRPMTAYVGLHHGANMAVGRSESRASLHTPE